MQYYDERKMHGLRSKIEKEILKWPNVTTKKMYGCPCYKNQERLFAFLVTDGVVLTNASKLDKKTLLEELDATPFQAGKRIMKNWPRIRLDETTDLERIIPFIRNSYDESHSL